PSFCQAKAVTMARPVPSRPSRRALGHHRHPPAPHPMQFATLRLRPALACALAMTALAAAFGAPAASAQDPRVVTIIVPYPAGGIGDILPRAMADGLGQQTGPTFVVDKHTGATQMHRGHPLP